MRKRELAEETGYTAEAWTSLGYLYASPGVLDEKLHLFAAEDLTAGDMRPEADEQLEPVVLDFAEAVRMCLSGEIRDAKTITALLLWEKRNASIGRARRAQPGDPRRVRLRRGSPGCPRLARLTVVSRSR